ncbi:hypothetical protein DA100_11195 [Vibrio sp. Hep-1b-8]|nr:hypothetical protein DA100_11195 [Vibrio sp. Hep-1b-8]
MLSLSRRTLKWYATSLGEVYTPKSRFSNFSPYRILLDNSAREDEHLDKTVASGEFLVIHLNTDELYKLYIKQCDYNKIEVPTYMPKLKVCIRLSSGRVYKMNAPFSFYRDVQHRNIYKPEQDIMSLTNLNIQRGFPSDDSRMRYYSQTLERYMLAYKADMLWKLPKKKSLTRNLRVIHNVWRSHFN